MVLWFLMIFHGFDVLSCSFDEFGRHPLVPVPGQAWYLTGNARAIWRGTGSAHQCYYIRIDILSGFFVGRYFLEGTFQRW